MESINNTVTLTGRIGSEPFVKQFDENKMVARFSFASLEQKATETGALVWETHWHQVVAWGRCATLVQQQVRKGLKMHLVGKKSCRQYTGKDGRLHEVNEVVLYNLTLLEAQTA